MADHQIRAIAPWWVAKRHGIALAMSRLLAISRSAGLDAREPSIGGTFGPEPLIELHDESLTGEEMPSPFAMAQREPCPYCENFAGRYSPTAGPPPVLFENDRLMAYLNPASHGGMPGHTLVVPKRHVETILDLTHEEEAELAHTVARAARVLTRELTPDGVLVIQRNGLAAEQTVNHVHFHVMPRRDGAAWPPTEWIDMTPLEERQELAALLSAAW